MDWLLDLLTAEQTAPTLAVALAAALALGIPFGLGRRTLAAVGLVVLGVYNFYPGGSAGLVDDVLAPVRSLAEETAEQRERRGAGVAGAVGSDLPGRGRRR